MRPHPDSFFRTASGREVQLKAHRARWSGDYPANSLPAIEECLRAPVARLEIDIGMLADADFLVLHDVALQAGTTGSGFVNETTRRQAAALRLLFRGEVSAQRPPLFSEVAAAIASVPGPSRVELDMKDVRPLPWPRVEELARLARPIRDRVLFNGVDWNLRRLLTVDPELPVSTDPGRHFDWVPEGREDEEGVLMPRGAYGYLDRHPIAFARMTPVRDYLFDRMGAVLRLVPGATEVHLRLLAFERMLADGVADAADLFHQRGLLLDVWTLDAGTQDWRERLARAVAAGVDVVTTNTPRQMAAAGRELP